MEKNMNRRNFLSSAALGSAAAFGTLSTLGTMGASSGLLASGSASKTASGTASETAFQPLRPNPKAPVTQLTHGPKYHWGAYYDQLHFDPTDRLVTGLEVDFHHRSPEPTDRIQVGLIDLEDKNRWTPIGSSVAWNWQQGPMFQWIPGREKFEDAEVVWNDRDGDRFYAHVYCPATGKYRELPHAAYVLAPNGEYALFPDFARLNDTRPGYGYCGVPDKNANVAAPDDAGIWKMDLRTGETKLLFSFRQVADMVPEGGYSKGAKHWFNHILIAPDSKRFLFLHRWRGEDEIKPNWAGWKTRLMTANADGSDIYVLNPFNMTSHLVWRDPTHIIAYANRPTHGNRFYVFEDKTQNTSPVGADIMKVDGHVSYLPFTDQKWILNDTYPDRERYQHPFLFHLPTEMKIPLGDFYLGKDFKGEWRCDLHPRASRDGRKVLVDSAHDGGRQIYMIDLTEYDELLRGK